MKRLLTLIVCMIFMLLAVTVYNANAAGIEQSNPFIQWMRTTLGSTVTTNQVSITSTAGGTVIKAAPTTGKYRYGITIRNLDATNTVYIGPSGITTSTGFPLKAGETASMNGNYAAIYGITAAGITVSVSYIEEGN